MVCTDLYAVLMVPVEVDLCLLVSCGDMWESEWSVDGFQLMLQ